MNRTAKIENWFVAPVNDGPGFVLKGTITEHPANPEVGPDGLHATSPLKTIDLEKGIATSQNTEYTLVGQPVQPEQYQPQA